MTITPNIRKRIASLCNIPVTEIDDTVLAKAIRAVENKSEQYWDALANEDQLDGNVPWSLCVAMVYDLGSFTSKG